MNTKPTLSNEVWHAAFVELQGIEDRAGFAKRIADHFYGYRWDTTLSLRVSLITKKKIEADLKLGKYSYAQIKEKHRVGMSTVQRVAADMRARGVAISTVGSAKRRLTRRDTEK